MDSTPVEKILSCARGALTNAKGMTMKILLVLLISCCMTVPAFSVEDPDPDVLGIYFDLNADDNCLTVGTVPYFAYLILSNPTFETVNAYEFSFLNCVCTGTEHTFFMTASNIAHGVVQGVDVGVHDKIRGDYIVGLSEPLMTTPATILHSWQYYCSAIQPIYMFIGPSSVPSLPDGLPVVQNADGSILISCRTSSGSVDLPVASVNADECAVATEHCSWGDLKALYR